MKSAHRSIPLFPLNVVLFPQSRLPLHIFEERYRTMITECIENGTEFGINLFERNHLHPVGCTAFTSSMVRRYADGSFDIIVEGGVRYQLHGYASTPIGYLQGDIAEIADAEEDVPEPLITRAIALYNSILDVAFPATEPQPFSHADSDTRMSFTIAEKAGLSLIDKQRLLELPSEKRRLEELVRHMELVIPVMREQEQLQRLIANDGYLPRSAESDDNE